LRKKMIRRFVNLVLEDYSRGRYSLHRLDVAKYLFYPSTAQAEAANAKKTRNEGGGGGGGSDKTKATNPPRIKRMRRLPEPSMSFSLFPPADDGVRKPDTWQFSSLMNNTFILLSPGRSEGRILHATQGGRTVVYDADAHAVIATTPSFPDPMERFPIAFSVPGAGGYMEEKESLYVMRSTISIIRPPPNKQNFYDPAPKQQDTCSGDFVVLDFNKPYKNWQRLPRPPFAPDDGVRPGSGSASNITIRSSTVVNGGRTICVSVSPTSSVRGVVASTTAPTASTPRRANGGTPAIGRCPSTAEPSTSPSSGPGSASPPTRPTTSAPPTSPLQWTLTEPPRRSTSGMTSPRRPTWIPRSC
jgi:hypothetical protein